MSHHKPVVMCFSGLDPTGGAGIQADIETLFSLGCHGAPIITALTVQDTENVLSLSPLSASYIADQAHTVIADMNVDCFKLGLLPNLEVIKAIHQILIENSTIPVVLDPVLAAGGGFGFGGEEVVAGTTELLMPLTTVVTPNTAELTTLIPDATDQESAAQALLATGCQSVLLTGTHADSDDVENWLYRNEMPPQLSAWPRLDASYHGSGCTLASAIAAGLAKGFSVAEAAGKGQKFTWEALDNGSQPGKGQHLPDRAYWQHESDE